MRKDMKEAIKKLDKNNIDPFMIDVSIQTSISLANWLNEGEPGDYVNNYFIKINLLDDNHEVKENVGHAICYYFSGYDWANDRPINLLYTADSISGDLLTAVEFVTNNSGELLEEYLAYNLLYIDTFYIKPQYRGKGIGTVAFPLLIDILGRETGVITIIPTPTDNNDKNRIDEKDPTYNDLYNDMCKFIMKWGFFCADRKNRVWAKNTALSD